MRSEIFHFSFSAFIKLYGKIKKTGKFFLRISADQKVRSPAFRRTVPTEKFVVPPSGGLSDGKPLKLRTGLNYGHIFT